MVFANQSEVEGLIACRSTVPDLLAVLGDKFGERASLPFALFSTKMKNILAVLILVTIAKGSPAWGDYQMGQWNKEYQPPGQWYSPSGYSPPLSREPTFGPPGQGFLPPGHSHTPPGHSHIPPGHSHPPPGYQHIPPGHMYLAPCQVLEQLFKLQVNQPSNSLDKSCNVGWICQNPETEDMTITTIDGTQIVIGKQQQPDNWQNQNGIHSNSENSMNDNPIQGNADNANLPNENSTPTANNLTTPHTNNESSRRGGEGLIDVRIGDS